MGIPVLILGESGSGKSASLRNFQPDEVGIFNVASKPLPFKTPLPKVDRASYGVIIKALQNAKNKELKTYVIDDSQFLMVFEEFEKAKNAGFQKFTDMAIHFYELVQTVIKDTPDDCIVYFLHHTEQTDTGKIKAKTVGHMIDSRITLEGLFSIVLLAGTDGNRHYFETQSDGFTTAKSPIGMFEERQIDNDLKLVDKTIRAYWGLKHDV